MVRALAGLTKLRDLCIEFSTLESESYEFHDELKLRTPQSPPLVVIFPALTKFQMGGDNEYLEHFMALVNAPRLENLSVEYPSLMLMGYTEWMTRRLTWMLEIFLSLSVAQQPSSMPSSDVWN